MEHHFTASYNVGSNQQAGRSNRKGLRGRSWLSHAIPHATAVLSALFFASLTACAPEQSFKEYSAYEGAVVLVRDVTDPPITIRERPDIVEASEGSLPFPIEIDGEQPSDFELLKFYPARAWGPDAVALATTLHWAEVESQQEPTEEGVTWEASEPVLIAKISHHSTWSPKLQVNELIGFRYPVNCKLGVLDYGELIKEYGGIHAGLDYICGTKQTTGIEGSQDIRVPSYAKALYNDFDSASSNHGLGHYVAEEYLLENARPIICLSAHRCAAAIDVDPNHTTKKFLARGQRLGKVSNCGFTSGIVHTHVECKSAWTSVKTDFEGPCSGYCNESDLGTKYPDTTEGEATLLNTAAVNAKGYRDPRLIFDHRTPLILRLFDNDMDARTHVTAGKGRIELPLRNFFGADMSFSVVEIVAADVATQQQQVLSSIENYTLPNYFINFPPLASSSVSININAGMLSGYASGTSATKPAGGFYKFYAHLQEKGQADVYTYPVFAQVVPDEKSTVADNLDPALFDASDMLTANARGGGYFLDHYRSNGNGPQWARWKHLGEPGAFKVWVYVPDDSCKGTVSYKLSLDGKTDSTGALASTRQSAQIDHTLSGWQALSFSGEHVVSLERGAVLGLSFDGSEETQPCVDAVMFEHFSSNWGLVGSVGLSFCSTDANCQTDTPCMLGLCNGGVCSATPAANGAACGGGNVCIDGSCQAVPGCAVASDCSDASVCTAETCQNGTCAYPPSPDGTPCGGGMCQSGLCAPACPCNSGPCCDGCNYLSSAVVCDSSYVFDCAGSAPGQDAVTALVEKHCSGTEATCTGATQQGSWQISEDCTSSEVCTFQGGAATCVPSCAWQYSYSMTPACGTKYCLRVVSVGSSQTTVAFSKKDGTTFGNFGVQWVVFSNGQTVDEYGFGLCGDDWNGKLEFETTFPTSALGLSQGSSVNLQGSLGIGPNQYDCATSYITATTSVSYLCQ